MSKGIAKDFDEYADGFPRHVQQCLRTLRETIRAAAPEATERISYRIPAFALNGILVWFGAHASHIGFYPGATAIAAFKEQLSAYKSAKGSVQFPFAEALPVALVSRIVQYRVQQQQAENAKREVPHPGF